MGWVGVENGALLRRAAEYEFDALVTSDAKMEQEQDVRNLPITVVLLKAHRNRLTDLQPLVPKIVPELSDLVGNHLVRVEARGLSKRKAKEGRSTAPRR